MDFYKLLMIIMTKILDMFGVVSSAELTTRAIKANIKQVAYSAALDIDKM